MYISWWVYFATGLNFVLQQPLTAALAKTKADIAKKEFLLLLVLLPLCHLSLIFIRIKQIKWKFWIFELKNGGLVKYHIFQISYLFFTKTFRDPPFFLCFMPMKIRLKWWDLILRITMVSSQKQHLRKNLQYSVHSIFVHVCTVF